MPVRSAMDLRLVALLLGSAVASCGNPVPCTCAIVHVVTEANGSPISGATFRFLSPPVAVDSYTLYEQLPGQYPAGSWFCRRDPFVFEVSREGFIPQQISYQSPIDYYHNCVRATEITVRLRAR